MTRETTEERASAMRAAMLQRREKQIEDGEACIVVLDHDVQTATQSFHADQELFCPATRTPEMVKQQIMSAEELCSLHGGKLKRGKRQTPAVRKKERAVDIKPIRAVTPEDKEEAKNV